MRARIGLIWAMVILLGVAAVLPPQVALAQAGPDAGQDFFLYLPALREGSVQPEQPQQPQPAAALATMPVPEAEQAQTAAFWTRERMLAATSLDILTVSGAPAANDTLRDVSRPGPKGKVPGSLPDAGAGARARALYPAEWARLEAEQGALDAGEGLLAPAAADDTDAFPQPRPSPATMSMTTPPPGRPSPG